MSLNYRQDRLFLGESGDLQAIHDQVGGAPLYIYDLKNITHRYQLLVQSLKAIKQLSVHYALKANSNSQILKKLKSLGAQVDVVSMGELQIALDSGFKASDVIFSGVAKSRQEILFAIDQKIKQINIESPQELVRVGELARQRAVRMPVALRMNPEVNPVTHPYITTGMSENKFGMDRSFMPELLRTLADFSDSLELCGLTMHIGSQLLELTSIGEALQKLRSMEQEFTNWGHPIRRLDIGGGLGVHYTHDDEKADFAMIQKYGEAVSQALSDFKGEVLIEPGRVLVARAGVLLCQVEYIKETPYKKFAIVNTGMHHLMRPTLYQAHHRILPLSRYTERSTFVYDVVGPICESSDYLAKNRPLIEVRQGESLAIADAGAYGFSMANNYNAHPLPQEWILD